MYIGNVYHFCGKVLAIKAHQNRLQVLLQTLVQSRVVIAADLYVDVSIGEFFEVDGYILGITLFGDEIFIEVRPITVHRNQLAVSLQLHPLSR